jgi:hypothetical protein
MSMSAHARITAREEIAGKPTPAQLIIKTQMAHLLLEDDSPEYEAIARRALEWWAGLRAQCPDIPEEDVLAAMILERVWGVRKAGK